MRWMLASAVFILLTLLVSRPDGYAAPLKESFAKGIEIPAGGFTTTERFRGGERAAVQVVVARREFQTTVKITVHEKDGKLIAEDTGRGSTTDMAAVFWYPPRDGEYKITVRNLEERPHAYFVCIR